MKIVIVFAALLAVAAAGPAAPASSAASTATKKPAPPRDGATYTANCTTLLYPLIIA